MPRNLRIFTIVTLKTQVQVESAPPVIESQAVSRSDDVCSFHRADDCMFRTVTDANLHPLTFHPCRLGKHRRELRRCLGWLCKGKAGWAIRLPLYRQVDELGERIVLSGQCRGIRGPSSSVEKAPHWFSALLRIAGTQIRVFVEAGPERRYRESRWCFILQCQDRGVGYLPLFANPLRLLGSKQAYGERFVHRHRSRG